MSGLDRARWFMPGRIEVLGKHTDYGGGRVLVCAVDRGVTVTAQALPDAVAGPARAGVVEASTEAFDGTVRLEVGTDPGLPPGHWARYVQTVMERLTSNFGELRPARISMTSTLPPASGMSSSSAVICAVALALADLSGLPQSDLWRGELPDRLALAGYAASIENGKTFGNLPGRPGVGTSGGSLDHTGMLTSEEGMVSYAQFDPMQIIDRVALPPELCFVVGVSGVLAEKTGAAQEAYNRGPALLQTVLDRWNTQTGRSDATVQAAVRSLLVEDREDLARPVDPADERLEPLRRVASGEGEARRLEQFLQESCLLVPSAREALGRGDLDVFAQLVERSQALAATHLENQVPETIGLVDMARDLGAVAASSFGAGWGGSVWALVQADGADDFAAAWEQRYRNAFPDAVGASMIRTRPGMPGHRLDGDA